MRPDAWNQVVRHPLCLSVLAVTLAWGQESAAAPKAGRSSPYFAIDLGDQDRYIYVSSIEWGSPDRWSITTRYIHMFDRDRDAKEWLNNFTAILSPGTDGGRIGLGYQGLSKRKGGLTWFGEARLVYLRTWGDPLQTGPNRNFMGAELRGSLTAVINLGVGYYKEVSAPNGPGDGFWGVHVGIGL